MPFDMTQQAPMARSPDYGSISEQAIGAKRSQYLADLLAKSAQDQRILHPLHGIGTMASALAAGLAGERARQQQVSTQQALVSTLGADVPDFLKAAVATGDPSAMNSVIQWQVAQQNAAAKRSYEKEQTAERNAREDQLFDVKRKAATEDRMNELREANRLSIELEREKAKAKAVEKAGDLTLKESTTLNKAGESFNGLNAHLDSYDDSFGGYAPGMSEWQQWAGRTSVLKHMPGAMDEAGANWWTAYQGLKNDVRHTLFGSALTATEKKEWDKYDIKPETDPTQARWMLNHMRTAAYRASLKLGRDMVLKGRSVDQVQNLTGLSTEELTGTELPEYAQPDTMPKSDAGAPERETATPAPAEQADPLASARAAIAAGAPREAVIKRLLENGIDPGGL